jgi:hypothetical protein
MPRVARVIDRFAEWTGVAVAWVVVASGALVVSEPAAARSSGVVYEESYDEMYKRWLEAPDSRCQPPGAAFLDVRTAAPTMGDPERGAPAVAGAACSLLP